MLSNIFNAIKSIIDFVGMQWQHIVSFVQNLFGAGAKLLLFMTYLPLFLVPFVSAAISIFVVRRILNR